SRFPQGLGLELRASCNGWPVCAKIPAMGFAARAIEPKSTPSFDLEAALMDQYRGPVAGLDEAGRGPWAGPVVVAAVILNPDRIPEGLNDSKVLTPEMREDRYAEILATAL